MWSEQTYLAIYINIRVQRHRFSEKIDDFFNSAQKIAFSPQISLILPSRSVKSHIKDPILCFFLARTNLSRHLHQYPSTESLFFWHIWWFLKFQLKKLLFDPQISPILSSKRAKTIWKPQFFWFCGQIKLILPLVSIWSSIHFLFDRNDVIFISIMAQIDSF